MAQIKTAFYGGQKRLIRTAAFPGTAQLPAVAFSYRAQTAEEKNRYRRDLVAAGDDLAAGFAVIARKLAALLTEWNVLDQDGQPVEITEKNIAALDDRLVDWMLDEIEGRHDAEAPEKN